MGKTNKKNIKNRNNSEVARINPWMISTIALAGCLIGTIIAGIIALNVTKDKGGDKDEYYTINLLKKQADINEAISGIDNLFEKISSTPVYLEVQTSDEDFDGYMYNNNGEIMAQASDASYTVVFTNDGRSVRCNSSDETMEYNTAIDIVTMTKNAVNGVRNKQQGFTISELVTKDSPETGIKEFLIDVVGTEACKKIYNTVSDEYATRIVETLTKYIQTTRPNYELHLRFGVVYTVDYRMNLYCDIVIDEVENNNWYCHGYIEIPDWELGEDWYNTEFNEENADKVFDMLSSKALELAELLGTNYTPDAEDTGDNSNSDVEENNSTDTSDDNSSSEDNSNSDNNSNDSDGSNENSDDENDKDNE